jgi:hypothetical protein
VGLADTGIASAVPDAATVHVADIPGSVEPVEKPVAHAGDIGRWKPHLNRPKPPHVSACISAPASTAIYSPFPSGRPGRGGECPKVFDLGSLRLASAMVKDNGLS